MIESKHVILTNQNQNDSEFELISLTNEEIDRLLVRNYEDDWYKYCKTGSLAEKDMEIRRVLRHWMSRYNDSQSQLQAAQAEIEQLKIKPAVFCDAAHCQFGKVIQIGDGWNEPYATDFDCSKADDLSKQGYDDFEMDGDYPLCPMFRFDVSDWEYVINQLEAENAALRTDNAEMVKFINKYAQHRATCALFSWPKKCTCGYREDHDALTTPHPGAALPQELEALRGLQTIATDVLNWLKKNGYGGTGHARCLEDALAAVKEKDHES